MCFVPIVAPIPPPVKANGNADFVALVSVSGGGAKMK
jgi:hypothetical protein